MDQIDFYALDEDQKKIMLEFALGIKGKCVSVSGGMCGEIYIFDQGDNASSRYVCAKIPKPLANASIQETNNRFVNELKKQLSYSYQMFVHWAFDFADIHGNPVALFRYWGSDLQKVIHESELFSITTKLSIIVYLCSGLSHCYKRGLVAHQDLKPANIFLRDVKSEFNNLPGLDVYKLALIADFGLANAFQDSSFFGGSRPYMAPEQWNNSELSPKTDIFALGVILYELMSGGFHPFGIKLSDYWPRPLEGKSTKWTRDGKWNKWAQTASTTFKNVPQVESKVQSLVQKMLSFDVADRPSIEEVKISLLDIIKRESQESFKQLKFLVDYFEREASTEPLEDRWPYLWDKWGGFQAKFEKRI